MGLSANQLERLLPGWHTKVSRRRFYEAAMKEICVATRGLQVDDFREVGRILATALTPEFDARAGELLERVGAIVERYPLYEELSAGTPA